MTPATLAAAIGCTPAVSSHWAGPISEAMAEFGITTPERIAAFLAQVAHESAGLTRVSENLNYRADRLLAVFPRYFDAENVTLYAGDPSAIASRVYANRMGNGPEQTMDGWHFRGRGLIQLTGRDNYRACGNALGVDLIDNPDLLTEADLAARSAAWFWQSHGLNELSDAGRFAEITKRINGGTHGQPARVALWEQAKAVLA